MGENYKLDGVAVKGDWEETTDPADAYEEMLAQGYDPDADYCVASTSGPLITVVYRGKLLDSLIEAANRSTEGYFVVLLASDLDHAEKVEVH